MRFLKSGKESDYSELPKNPQLTSWTDFLATGSRLPAYTLDVLVDRLAAVGLRNVRLVYCIIISSDKGGHGILEVDVFSFIAPIWAAISFQKVVGHPTEACPILYV